MKRRPTTQEKIRVAMVEDDQLRQVGLRSLLEPSKMFELVAMSPPEIGLDGRSNLALIGSHSGLRFFDTMASLSSQRPDLRVLVIGSSSDEETIFKAIAAGAKGYIQESAPASELARALWAVHGGLIWAPRRVISMFIERSSVLSNPIFRPWSLTSREKEVLRMLVEGRSNKEIGLPLGIEERTVKAHVAKMMRKVGVRNRIALTVHAISHSLLASQCS